MQTQQCCGKYPKCVQHCSETHPYGNLGDESDAVWKFANQYVLVRPTFASRFLAPLFSSVPSQK